VHKPFVILMVDDNDNNLFTLRELLSRLPGLELCSATNGEDALNTCIERDIHLLLLDVQMPGMDGYETAKHLQMTTRTREIPIVFLTAFYKSEAFIQRGYELGAVDYLTKPIDDNLLLNRVRNYQHLFEREAALKVQTFALQTSSAALQATVSQLQATQAQLVETQKLAALGNIVTAVAHELNTPIGNCILLTSTLDSQLKDFQHALVEGPGVRRSQLQEFMERTQVAMDLLTKSLRRSAELVANFKAIKVERGSLSRRTFAIKEVVDATIKTMAVELGASAHTIDTHVPVGLMMESYPEPLEVVIRHLVNNARLHAFEGRAIGRMLLSVKAVDSNTIELVFEDDGCGMTEELQGHIFEPFFTTKLGKGGSGLGLNICYSFVMGILGGQIAVHSAPGKGSRFVITIPRIAPETVAVQALSAGNGG
jgi:signal transduction histidine kinase